MTNLIILLLVWCAGIVLCYAWWLSVLVRRVFREEIITELVSDHPLPSPDGSNVLGYGKPPRKNRLLRQWPILVAALSILGVLSLMAPPLIPVLGMWYFRLYYSEAVVVCRVAFGLTLLVMILVAWRGLKDVNGRPAAGAWLLGRVVLCWPIMLMITCGGLWWRTQRIFDATLAKADALGRQLEIISADGKTAAALYQQAGIGLEKGLTLDDYWELMTDEGRMVPPPAFPQAQAFCVPLLRQAAAMATSGLNPPASEYSLAVKLPYLPGMRRAALLLQRHAISEAEAGRIESAIADINAIHGIAKHADQGLALVESLVGTGTHKLAFDTLQEVLPFVRDPKSLELLEFRTLTEGMSPIRRGVQADFGMCLPRSLVEVSRTPSQRSALLPRVTSNAMQTAYSVALREIDLGAMEEFAGQVPQMIPDDPAAAAAMTATISGRMSRSIFVAISANMTEMAIKTRVEMSAMFDLSRSAVAATRFRLQHGRLPDSFEELVHAGLLPAVPIDPFNGKPMCFAVHESYVFIYTIGRSRTDGGGTPYIAHPGGYVVRSNPGFILSARPLWDLDLVPPGAAAATTQPAPATQVAE